MGAQLDERFVVFDPMAIKDSQAPQPAAPPGPPPTGGAGKAQSGGGDGGASPSDAPFSPAEMQYMADQTVARDYKLIKQSDFVVVYYPTTVLSAGVISEMIYAVANGKQVFAVWLPSTEPSPFFSYYCTAPVFRSTEALFTYFERTGLARGASRDCRDDRQ